jgi:hypothetical protein
MPRVRLLAPLMLLGAACLVAPIAQSVPVATKAPKLEPVADAKLLMNGLAEPNFKGVGKLLKDRPKEGEAWEFMRGRALLIAETGNLLMIRPPKAREPQDSWMTHGTELREAASALAKAAGEKDYLKSRAAFAGVANACNRCHRTFNVASRVQPFPDEDK